MKYGKDCFESRSSCLGVDVDRNSTPIVLYSDGVVGMKCEMNIFAVASERFIYSIINDFLDEMV
jgi:hypothetical protein